MTTAMSESPVAPSLKRFFDRLVRRSLEDLRMGGDPAADYLAGLLARFARTDQLYALRGAAGRPLESVVEMLLEVQRSWEFDQPHFNPFRERDVRQHIGDYTLFMTGIFPERVAREAGTTFYIAQGKRAYQFVSEHARASSAGATAPYRRLADRFESYVGALDYARRVHFFDAPAHSFFRLRFE
jgi:hypothetical protein